MKTTVKRYLMIAAAALVVFAVAGCDLLGVPLTDTERMNAFLATANEASRDYVAMQGHFSETAPSYTTMNTSGFWESTNIFELPNQPFSVTGATTGGEVSGYPGSTSISGTLVLGGPSLSGAVTFVFVEDSTVMGNRLIRAIDYNSGTDVIENRVD